MNLCEDASTYLLSIIIALQNIPDRFPMNRIGTIMNEHFFSLLRFRSGKEQTLKSFKRAFQQIILSMKNNILTKNMLKLRRYFDSGITDEGVFILSKPELLKCKELALSILRRAWLIFPRESEFYKIIEHLISQHQTFNEYTDWDWDFFDSIINAKFQMKKIKTIRTGMFTHQILD